MSEHAEKILNLGDFALGEELGFVVNTGCRAALVAAVAELDYGVSGERHYERLEQDSVRVVWPAENGPETEGSRRDLVQAIQAKRVKFLTPFTPIPESEVGESNWFNFGKSVEEGGGARTRQMV